MSTAGLLIGDAFSSPSTNSAYRLLALPVIVKSG
jgi:hypothetical protein